MRKFILFLMGAVSVLSANSQELNCTISIDAAQTGQPNLQIFRTLETQLREFVNNTKWTDKEYKNQERIDCNMSLVISKYDSDTFTATLQIQSSRPIFDSTYDSPVYNYFDRQVNFSYKEFEPLTFNINTFGSNIVSIVAFHVYTILGLDADTYTLNGGTPYFEIAKQITNTAAASSYTGWKSTDGNQSRYTYNDALLSSVYKEFHDAMYQYHRDGLDIMSTNPKQAKEKIADAINILKGVNDRRPNSFLVRTFFDAKSDEITGIFSGGPQVDVTKLIENLNRIAPTKRTNWAEIKF